MKITDLFEGSESAAFKVNTISGSDDAATVYVNSSSINIRLNHLPSELQLKFSDSSTAVDYYSVVRQFMDQAGEVTSDQKAIGKLSFQLSSEVEQSTDELIKEFTAANEQVMAAITTYFKGAILDLKNKIEQKNQALAAQYVEKVKNGPAA